MSTAHDVWRDIRYASRTFRKSPVFSAVAVLTLAVGIGVNAAVFSVMNALFFRPLPVADADRLVVIASVRDSEPSLGPMSYPDLQDLRDDAHEIFEDIAGYSVGFLGLAVDDEPPARILVSWVTGNYFSALGVRPFQGRLFHDGEGRPDTVDRVVVLGYATWQERFGAAPGVIGRTVRINGEPYTIVGVAPQEFLGTFAFSRSELFLPINTTGGDGLNDRSHRLVHTIGRLRSGFTRRQAQAAVDVIAARLQQDYPETNGNVRATVVEEVLARPVEDNARSNAFVVRMLLLLPGFVLLVAGVNLASLFLSRAVARRKELAVRAALGASRGRLVRQLLAESSTLAVLGGIAGAGLGVWTAHLLASIRPPGDLPIYFDFRFDYRVLGYLVLLTTVTAGLIGAMTAIRASKAHIHDVAHATSQRTVSTRGSHRVLKALVIAQVAVCFTLLVAGGLFIRSLSQAQRIDLGFRPDNVLNVQMDVAHVGYDDLKGRAFFTEVGDEVRALPGVQDAAFAFSVPMGYVRTSAQVEAEGQPRAPNERVLSGKNLVDAHYFETMGIAIEDGRAFVDADTERSPHVAIINRRLAEMLWPGQDPIGRYMRQGGADSPRLAVIGVAATGKYRSLFEDQQPHFYVPLTQAYSGVRVLHVRTRVPPQTLAPVIAQRIAALEPALPLYDVQTMHAALNTGYGLLLVRWGAWFAGLLGIVGMLLTLLGLSGVVSYTTSQRMHEFGVRMALGATPRATVALVLRDAVGLTGTGIAIGFAGALVLARALSSLLVGVGAADRVSFATAAGCVLFVALVATYIPARNATRADPMVTLRAE